MLWKFVEHSFCSSDSRVDVAEFRRSSHYVCWVDSL